MGLLRTLTQILRPPQPTGFPFGLSASEFASLKSLHGSEEWKDYLKLLDLAANFYAEQLLSTDADAEVHRLRGVVIGLRKAGTLVTELIRQQDHEDVHRRRRVQHDDFDLFYGSRYSRRS